jgi:hypothetical protein
MTLSIVSVVMVGAYCMLPLLCLTPDQQMLQFKLETDMKRLEIEKRYEAQKEIRSKYIEMAKLIIKQWDGKLPQVVIGSAVNSLPDSEDCE